MSSPVVFRTIREQIANQIRNEVLSGQLAEGEALREVKLAARFGVSRGPIRDALLQLTQEGLLTQQPNVGVRVGNRPSEAIRPLVVKLRRQIERYALASIWDQITDDDVGYWVDQLAKLKAACEAGDMTAIVEHDLGFHRSLVERTGDVDLLAIWLPIVLRMMLHYSRHEHLLQVHEEHARIVQAIQQRKKEEALKALEGNIW